MAEVRIKFRHGLGDCVHFAYLLQLYLRRKYKVYLHGEVNKHFIWELAGVVQADESDVKNVGWGYPAEFENLSAPDHLGNKIAHGINHTPLPCLGEKEALWRNSVMFV